MSPSFILVTNCKGSVGIVPVHLIVMIEELHESEDERLYGLGVRTIIKVYDGNETTYTFKCTETGTEIAHRLVERIK